MKKILFVIQVVILGISLVGCDNAHNDPAIETLSWTNDNAVYAYIKAGYENEILNNVEDSFSKYSFTKVFVVEKNVNIYTPLVLLFIINENEELNQQAFRDTLELDERINHTTVCRDFPFETVDTLYIDCEKTSIEVGETLSLEVKGYIDYYVQPFLYDGLMVKMKESSTDKIYNISDFQQIDLKEVKKCDDGWLRLVLKEEGYYNVINAIDIISRLSTVDQIETDKSNYVSVIHPIWQASNTTIIEFVDSNYGNKTIIKGIKQGKVTIDYGGASCEITVK